MSNAYISPMETNFHEVNLSSLGNMHFDTQIMNHSIQLAASPAHGGNNQGPSPKPLLLASLGGCTGLDVVSLLKKMRVHFEKLNISVKGELSSAHPQTYTHIYVHYHLFSNELDALDKLQKAVNLSLEQYCGVSAMLRKSSEIIPQLTIHKP